MSSADAEISGIGSDPRLGRTFLNTQCNYCSAEMPPESGARGGSRKDIVIDSGVNEFESGSFFPVLLETLLDDVLVWLVYFRFVSGQRVAAAFEEDDLHFVFAQKGPLLGQYFPQDHPERVDVGRPGDLALFAHQLRRHVGHTASVGPVDCTLLQVLCTSKIRYLSQAEVVAQQNVLRLQVPMHYRKVGPVMQIQHS